MKNLMLFFFAAMLWVTACTTEELDAPKNEKEAKIAESAGDPKFLVFESVSEYDSILDTLKNLDDSLLLVWAQGFVGYNSRLQVSTESQLETDGIYDELLAAILSEQNIVQIDNHVFQLNFSTEQVYVLNELDYDNPSDFAVENPNMDVYSFNDNVIDEVSNKKTGTYCSKNTSNPGWKTWNPVDGDNSKKIQYGVFYLKYGIKNTLIVKMKKNYYQDLDFEMRDYKNITAYSGPQFDDNYYETENVLSDFKMLSRDNNGKKRPIKISRTIYSGRNRLKDYECSIYFDYYLDATRNGTHLITV